jgi:iron complex outermembrane receptor protein
MRISTQFAMTVVALAACQAMAQTAPAANPAGASDAKDTSTLETVIVTAQRRPELIQKTPVAVTALSSEALESRQVTNVMDIAAQVPNLRIEPVTGLSNASRVFIRGVGEDQSTPTTDAAIGMYVDGVYYPRTLGALFDLVDVQRIEVLRGPQGTLYGRNTSGGAVKIITRDPGDTFEGTAEWTAGSFGRQQLRAAVGGPLGRSLRASLSVLQQSRDGTSIDSTLGRDVNRKDLNSVRGKFIVDATENLEFKLVVDQTTDKGDVFVGTSGFTGVPANLLATTANADPAGYLQTRGAALTGTYASGDYTLTSITAWRDLKNFGTLDNDAEERTINHFAFDAAQRQFSQELTLAAKWGRVEAIMGAYWFNEDNTYASTTISGSRANPAAALTSTVGLTTQKSTSSALFGQATYSLTDAIRLTAGGRQTSDKKTFADVYPARALSFAAEKEWSAFTPRLGADYQMNKEIFLFSSYSKGYKSGGFNRSTVAVTALTPYDQEDVTTFEAGVKTDLLDGRLRTNVTYFSNSYKALQLSAFDPATNVSRRFNAASATTSGVEIEVSAIPVKGLRTYATLGYLSAKYDSFFDRINGVLTDVSYLKLKGAPRTTGSLGFSWLMPVAVPGSLRLNADVSLRSQMENNIANTPIIASPALNLLNASLVWNSADGHWTTTLAGKNLTNKSYIGAGLYIGGLLTNLYPADPRTLSASLRYRF